MKLKILLSYWYYRNTDLDELFEKHFSPDYPEVFADSGAFSAMTQGGEVSIMDYAAWIHKWKHRLTVYANLDVIKNAEATWKNQQVLENEYELQPLPAFHVLEDFYWLEHYLERYPYIALGVAGMQQRHESIMAWITRCFKLAAGKAVFHGFGLTSWQVMRSFPWYSVDSSSWGQGFRYGVVPIWNAKKHRFVKIKLGDPVSCYRYANTVRALGFDPADFAERKRNDRTKICAVSALSYMLAEAWLRSYWGEIFIPGNKQPGIRVYMADGAGLGTRSNFTKAQRGIKVYLVDTRTTLVDLESAHKGLKQHEFKG